MSDAMRWIPDVGAVSAMERCAGVCHEVGDDDCSRCGSLDASQMCWDCCFYAAQDGAA